MNKGLAELIGAACYLIPRQPAETIRSEAEARQLIAWADAALDIAYAAGEYEITCDLTGVKQSALSVRYESERYLAHKKLSDIVADYRALVSNLRVICESASPAMAGYLEFRLEVISS